MVSASRTDLKKTRLFLLPCLFYTVRCPSAKRECGLPHQCEHWAAHDTWFYIAGSFLRGAYSAAPVGNMLACSAFSFCIAVDCGTGEPVPYDTLFLHCACPGAKGTRIATPVCALVRNDTGFLRSRVIFTFPSHFTFYFFTIHYYLSLCAAAPVCALARNDTGVLRSCVFFTWCIDEFTVGNGPAHSAFRFAIFVHCGTRKRVPAVN